jgi:hypothetical protein
MRKLIKLNWKTTLAGACLIGLEVVKVVQPTWAPVITSLQTSVIGGGLVAAADGKRPRTRQPKD